MAKLQHPDATSCSVDGKTYSAGADGLFDVPEGAVAVLAAHGFTPVPAKPTESEKKGKKG